MIIVDNRKNLTFCPIIYHGKQEKHHTLSMSRYGVVQWATGISTYFARSDIVHLTGRYNTSPVAQPHLNKLAFQTLIIIYS